MAIEEESEDLKLSLKQHLFTACMNPHFSFLICLMGTVLTYRLFEKTAYDNEGESTMNNKAVEKYDYTKTRLLWVLNDTGWILEIKKIVRSLQFNLGRTNIPTK